MFPLSVSSMSGDHFLFKLCFGDFIFQTSVSAVHHTCLELVLLPWQHYAVCVNVVYGDQCKF